MNRQNIIVLLKINGHSDFYNVAAVETWGNLKEACEAHGWPYWTIVKKDLPITYDGWKLYRVPFKQEAHA